MESFTKKLSSNASALIFPENTLSSLTSFLPELLNMEGQGEVAISEISYPSVYQNVTEGKFMSSTTNFQTLKCSAICNLVFTLPLWIFLKHWPTLIQKRHNHNASCITVKMSRRIQKIKICLANEGPGLGLFSTVLGLISRSNVCTESGVMLRGKGPHKTDFADDIVRIHSLMIYAEVFEDKIVDSTKAPLLRCFSFSSKLKAGDILTIGQYMNYKTFNNLQFRPLLKNSFYSIHNDLWNTSGEKVPFESVGIPHLFLMFKKASKLHF